LNPCQEFKQVSRALLERLKTVSTSLSTLTPLSKGSNSFIATWSSLDNFKMRSKLRRKYLKSNFQRVETLKWSKNFLKYTSKASLNI
jgi:hypothetical protein